MNNHNLLYIVTDTTAYKASHITINGPEQFIHWIETEIIHHNKGDGQIMDAANRLITLLNRQIAGEAMYRHIIPAAKELDLRVTVIAGTIIADWNE